MKKLFILLALTACGMPEKTKIVEVEVLVPDVPDWNDDRQGQGTDWSEFKTLFTTYCESCHRDARFASSEESFRDPDNRVEAMLTGRQMPPNGMPDAERAKMRNFF